MLLALFHWRGSQGLEKSIYLYPQIPLKASLDCWEPCSEFWDTCQDSLVPGSVTHIVVRGWEMIYTSAVQAVRARLGWCHQCRLHQGTVSTAAPKDRGWWQNQAWNQNQTLKPPSSSACNVKVMQLFGELNHF